MPRKFLAAVAAVIVLTSPVFADCNLIAAPPGQPQQCIPLTDAEIQQRQLDAQQVTPVPMQEQLDSIYETLTIQQRASLAPLKAAIKLELDQGHLDVAKAIIQGATVPPELEPLRQELLSKFGG